MGTDLPLPRRDWGREEVEAIVADYLHMLMREMAGQNYSKTAHRNACSNGCTTARFRSNPICIGSAVSAGSRACSTCAPVKGNEQRENADRRRRATPLRLFHAFSLSSS